MPQMIFDGRWEAPNGIGRMASELRRKLFSAKTVRIPPWPSSAVSPFDPFVQGLALLASPRDVFYSPGFNAPAMARSRTVFTVHDLIHLRVPGEAGALKRAYYHQLVRPAVSQAFRVLTVSEYSRLDILEWSGAEESQVLTIGNGVDAQFFATVEPHAPGYPYFFYVGARKPHKNLDRLLEAYAVSKAKHEIRLLLSGSPDPALMRHAQQLQIADDLSFAGHIPDAALPAYYRGAVALLFPSFFEGFGFPPVEAMAGGTPVLSSNATSLAEVVGEAALIVDPFSVEALRDGIDRVAFDQRLRERLRRLGPLQAQRYSWDAVAAKVKPVLDELEASVSP